MRNKSKKNKSADNKKSELKPDNTKLTIEQKATNADTWQHIELVMRLLSEAQIELMRRQFAHDRSKLQPPEVSTFTEVTPKLTKLTYGSEEYKQMLASMKPALDHHYTHNRHHPEHFRSRERSKDINQHILMIKFAIRACNSLTANTLSLEDDKKFDELLEFLHKRQSEHQSSINNMNLFDILEMFLDWYAATKRHEDGDIRKSIEINKERFGISDQLIQVFLNTVEWLKERGENII